MHKLNIIGMKCSQCAAKVTRVLESLPGVIRVVRVRAERGEALIEGEPDIQALLTAVEKAGYQAEVTT